MDGLVLRRFGWGWVESARLEEDSSFGCVVARRNGSTETHSQYGRLHYSLVGWECKECTVPDPRMRSSKLVKEFGRRCMPSPPTDGALTNKISALQNIHQDSRKTPFFSIVTPLPLQTPKRRKAKEGAQSNHQPAELPIHPRCRPSARSTPSP